MINRRSDFALWLRCNEPLWQRILGETKQQQKKHDAEQEKKEEKKTAGILGKKAEH